MAKKRIQRKAVAPGRGGARKGAGRKSGRSLSNKTIATIRIAEAAATDGKKLPLDIMLEVMRYHWAVVEAATKPEEAEAKLAAMDKAFSMAERVAPYIHPRLQSTELKNKDGEQFAVRFVDDIK